MSLASSLPMFLSARTRGRKEDVGALAVEVGDGILVSVRVELGIAQYRDTELQ